MEQSTKSSIFQTSLRNFELTADRLNLDEAARQRLLGAKEKIELRIAPMMPTGHVKVIKAFIVKHQDALGPAKGGIRMTPEVTMDDIAGLAMEMTWKTALIGVPFGGGKSGIQCDARELSPEARQVIIRAFTRAARRHIGPEVYIPAPDMGTNETDMGHIRDCISYSDGVSITNGCFVTGKPVILGGILGRREATGKGVVYTIQAMCNRTGLEVEKASVVLQGFGNVGSVTALEMARRGAKVTAVADLSGTVLNKKGLDVDALWQHVQQTGCVRNFSKARILEKEQIFDIDCDIFIPAAGGSQITVGRAAKINTKIIAEAANAPTVPEADDILNQRGITVIPDILCNAGGVFVSYLEYTQETQREQITLSQVEQRLVERMERQFNDVFEYACKKDLSLRQAAMCIAVGRVAEAIFARGLLP